MASSPFNRRRQSRRNKRHFDKQRHAERFGVDYTAEDRDARSSHAKVYRQHDAKESFGKELADLSYDADERMFTFRTPKSPDQRNRGDHGYHRAAQRWATYHGETGELHRMGVGNLQPTPDEARSWSDEASFLADKWTGRLDELGEQKYMRFGRIPPSGRSTNHATRQEEPGVSVYPVRRNPRSGGYEIDDDLAHDPAGAITGAVSGRQPYLVNGDENGRGSDGEVTLTNTQVESPLEFDLDNASFFPK